MRAKETLQLRHQLSASGLSLRAATYDTKRHHVLTFDSHPLRPHVLRLFSLRRELKSVPLLDKIDEESTIKREPSSNSRATQVSKRSSFLELQLQQEQQKRLNASTVETVVPNVLLQYSPTLDVFICVYSKATRPKGSTKVPKTTTHYVVLLEPATLRKLLVYHGPESHLLQCAYYDPLTDRLALASHLESGTNGDQDGGMLPKTPQNVVEILQLTKRLDDQDVSWSSDFSQTQEQLRMLLFIENTRASLRYPDALTLICGSRGLREIYGVSNDFENLTDTLSMLLQWRQNQPKGGRFMLMRRVVIQHRIISMAVSPCGNWLIAGCCKGGLRVWNVNGSRTNESELFTIDAEPFEPTGDSVADAQTEVISSIEITTTPTSNSTDNVAVGSPDVIVIAVERDTGAVRHWKFSVERETFESGGGAASSGEHRYPRLSLVGYFNAGGKKQVGKEESPRKSKNQDTMGPPLKTLTMCVTIDMGSCFENLLLVVHEDVIHVLKVQSVLYVMQECAANEETYAVRAFGQQDAGQVISLSSTAASKLRIFPLDEENSSHTSSKLLFVTPQLSAHVCSMETVTNDRMQISFVVLAWSNGIVDVYDVQSEKQVMKLQDKHLTDDISTMTAVTYQRFTKRKDKPTLYEAEEAGFWSSRSYVDLSQNHESNLADYASSEASDEPVTQKLVIVVGTESGKLYGWNAGALLNGDFTFQSIEKANVRVQAAHSAHIIQLARIDAVVRGERALLASVGAGGVIKLWSVPSLKMTGYVNSVAEGYPVSSSCIELMMRNVTAGEMYASVGYEDGRLAVWRVDIKHVVFRRLEVSTRHERRVTKICWISSDVTPAGSTEFLSCSLDMTVIQWEISEAGTVQEKRYFDIGDAIVDMVLIREQAVIALAHEVCKFLFASSAKSDMKYLLKAELETNSEIDEQQRDSAAAPPLTDDDYPDTPTTRSVEDPAEEATPTRRASRSVDEYLTLHVPSAILQLEATSPSVVAADTATESAPATREQSEDQFNQRNDKLPQYMRSSKSADKLQYPLVDDDVLREYLQEYIARHGTGGTMAANRITHLLALRPELPSIKRPGFALAKSLKDLKLTAQARLDPEEAMQILRMLFAMAESSNQLFNASTMARDLKQKEHTKEKARAQQLREKKQARRKAVVTYNVLGEKYVRWEEEPEEVGRNQSPTSSANSLVVHTPPSPNMRDVIGFEKNSPPDAVETPTHDQSILTGDTRTIPNSNSYHETSRESTDDSTPPNVLPSEGNIPGATNQQNVDDDSEEEGGGEEESEEEESEEEDNDGNGDSNGDDNDAFKNQNHDKMDPAALNEAVHAPVPIKAVRRSKHTRKYRGPSDSLSRNALVMSIRLSPLFQQFWTTGYCWCKPAPQLRIIWSEKDAEDSQDHKPEATKRISKCKACHKRLHTVKLPRVGYAPHFSRQTTFDIIVEVYSKLTATAHTRLYKKSSTRKEHMSECSIFGALFEVFLATYGLRGTVEIKLKQFFVSMCHFLPEYDAVAVFGELLGLHASDAADECDQAPATLVALCVCCYSWLYSRGMVANGDYFSGRLRGRGWGTGDRAVATEVVAATDGATHWQFIRIEHALLCAQDNLLYPLVSPGFLRNIMLFMQEYAQQAPTRSLRTHSPDFTNNDIDQDGSGSALWIELHRFLRLLVGEWKHQNAQFRVVERLLFVYPQRDAAIEGALLEKLRLMLSCFVFYDHERVGVMATSDFETLLYKLRYLWTEESTAVDPAFALTDSVFDDVISATKKRFLDLNHDGQLCYLDFWAMLYVVGVKTSRLIHFHAIPSFCRDYRLEVSPELSDMVWNYMQLSCTLLLPKGLEVGKSSMDQKAERQHRRRVGGLHDGTFHFSKTLKGSLSTQELLGSNDTQKFGLYLDGSIPATRQTASTTALDRFRPVSVETELNSDGSSRRRGREPVVVGVRSTGPTPKPIAPLRVSVMGNSNLPPEVGYMANTVNCIGMQNANSQSLTGLPHTAYTNTYIQFPRVTPMRRRVGPNEIAARQIIVSILVEENSNSEEDPADYEDSTTQQEEVQMEIPSPAKTSLTHTLSATSVVMVPEIAPLPQNEQVAVEQPQLPSRKSSLEKRRNSTAVVVVPTVEPRQQSVNSVMRAMSEQIKLEEAVAQLEAEKVSLSCRQPPPAVPVVTASEEPSPESESDDNESTVFDHNDAVDDADDVEQSSEHDEECPAQEEPEEPVPIIVEEVHVLSASEPVVEVSVETVEPVIEQPSLEEVAVESVVELPTPVEEPPEQVIVAEVIAEIEVPVEEEVNSQPTTLNVPVDEPIPTEEPVPDRDTESEVTSEVDMGENTNETPYTSQVIKQDEIQIHHAYRFSQQPTFLRSVTVTSNPYRTAMWNPNDDSESDGDDGEAVKRTTSKPGDSDVNDSIYNNDDENLVGHAHKSTSQSASMLKTGAKLKSRSSSSQLTGLDSNFHSPHRIKQTNDDLEALQDESYNDLGGIANEPLMAFKRKRLDEDAERALYGERVVNVLGEGIVFSPEAEASMQQKWQQFFDDSESKMFTEMRNDLEKKQTEQREAEERQRKLRKKWQEQRDQDLLRLQSSRQNSTLLVSTKQDATNDAVDAGFRLRRIHRESCRQLTEELQFGVSVQRGFKQAKETQFFHFYYLPEGHGSIITLKMHVLRGDAEVFMSTDTKVPCSTDFMWRSSERLAKDSGEGHRIILYPHDLLKAVTAATANAAPTEQAASIEVNTSSASLRSFYPKQPDVASLKVGFYLSVVALEPGTAFTLAVMSSGQKMQPSRAIQTVDYLIDRFNMLSRSFEEHSEIPSAFSDVTRAVMPSTHVRRNGLINLQSSADDEGDLDGDEEDNDTADNESSKVTGARRKTKKITAEAVDPQELKSFQYLLETLSEKKGFGSPRAASILLAGPSEEHLEFVQDEDQRLQEIHQRLSPPKTCPAGLHDSVSIVTERRLTLQGRRQKLRRVVAARLQQKLAPLHHKSIAGGELAKSASTGTLMNIRPRPVAYSITTLDPLFRSQRFMSPLQTIHNAVVKKGSTVEAGPLQTD